MNSVVPKFSRNKVNKAGRVFLKEIGDITSADEVLDALDVITNWRSAHAYPINTFQATLRAKVKGIDGGAIVAQRLKRWESIVAKLHRYPSMQLSRMQDIGGLRAIVNTIEQVRELEKKYLTINFRHELVSSYDYIANPKDTGYRSIHLVYRYRNTRASAYNGLLIELQFRTRLQHAWATAVETMGTFINYALKSSEGPKEWLDFFSLTGAAFAQMEETTLAPGYEHLSQEETFDRVRNAESDLDVRQKLMVFTIVADAIHQGQTSGSYHLLMLDMDKKVVQVRSFSRNNLDEANEEYFEIERQIREGANIQAVLVSTVSIDALRSAYPSYFLDTQSFIRHLNKICPK